MTITLRDRCEAIELLILDVDGVLPPAASLTQAKAARKKPSTFATGQPFGSGSAAASARASSPAEFHLR